jgi:uncharacterized phage protein (TIGR01671 family)
MTREIKFRIWDESNKAMYYNFSNNDFNSERIVHQQDFNDLIKILQKVWKFMQFTGLKDKNGKEIYEGDILKDKYNNTFSVEYGLQEVDAFEGYGWNVWTFMDGARADGERLQRTYEIIGNIYENPELL